MATTVTIQNSINWAAAFVIQRPTTGVGGIADEPALTTANLIMQSILSAPFKWEWNRSYAAAAINVIEGQSDYKVNLPAFGYLETAVLINPNATGATLPATELEIYKVISKDVQQNRPLKIATLLDDNAGNITFRLFPVPDQVYTVDLIYQNAPINIPQGANLATTTWAPIPDKMAILYQRGFLAQLQGIYNSQLYLSGMEMFFRQLVAMNEGLTEAEKAIFIDDKLRALKTQAAEMLSIQQGKASRS